MRYKAIRDGAPLADGNNPITHHPAGTITTLVRLESPFIRLKHAGMEKVGWLDDWEITHEEFDKKFEDLLK